jgi:ABC-2 type transport system ATP-binding protein/lipopolysaccharide transport system ATP-binding protein
VSFDDVPDQPVALRSVGVLNTANESTAVLRRDEPIVIEVGFVVRTPVPDLNLAVSVESLRGVRLLDESLSDHAPVTLDRPGRYLARVTIPPVLNTGDYLVSVWLGTDFEDFGWVERAVAFHLEGVAGGRPDRLIQLRAPWEVGPAEDPTWWHS